jgi:hypothetical protein
MTPKPLERDIEKRIRAYAVSRGCQFEKFVSPAKRGVADRVIIAPGGAVGWLEIKRPGAKPTELQMARLNEKLELGCNASWCDNVTDGCKFVDSLVAEGARRKWDNSQAVARIHGK